LANLCLDTITWAKTDFDPKWFGPHTAAAAGKTRADTNQVAHEVHTASVNANERKIFSKLTQGTHQFLLLAHAEFIPKMPYKRILSLKRMLASVVFLSRFL